MLSHARVPVVGLVGFSGVGKTTLVAKLLPLLNGRALRIGVIKHAPHGFELDRPGKDSYVLRAAGANPILIGSTRDWALLGTSTTPLALNDLLARIDQGAVDAVLVEGFKDEIFPKIELHRPSLGRPLLCMQDSAIVAVATDGTLATRPAVPVLDLNQPETIADFIVERFVPTHAERSVGE